MLNSHCGPNEATLYFGMSERRGFEPAGSEATVHALAALQVKAQKA
jgi:hypothetical protein